jgi:hypothetical protein
MSATTSGWKTMLVYDGDENEEYVRHIAWGPVDGWYADTNTAYGFFDTEKEAAADFLKEVREHPEAEYRRKDYEEALRVVNS